MATPLLIPSLATGEVAPSLFGRIDIDRERIAAGTMRNAFVNYRGGADSRPGTAFTGFSKQTGHQYPPRLITFQFSIGQGLALEFGDFYMRVISNGAFVTETPVGIGGATQALPCVITFGTDGADTATPDNSAVTFSYAPGDLITLAGGTYLNPAVLEVTSSALVSILPDAHGTGYAVNDTVTLDGGTFSVAAVVKVTAVAAYAAAGYITFDTIPADGDTVTLNSVAWTFKDSGATGDQTNIQATLAGTLAQLAADLNASAEVNLTPATYSSDDTRLIITYDATGTGGNAYTLVASAGVVSGASLAGGTTNGIDTVSIDTAGTFTALPTDGNMTESATSGGGSGASFQTAVFGVDAASISNPGAYTATPADPVAQASTTGIGVGVTFSMTWAAVAPFSNDDWIEISGVEGMTELNGNSYRLAGVTATTAELLDVYGDQVDSRGYGAYTGSGTAARIYTLETIYSEQDLKWLKVVESADVMTICCVNQDTDTEYKPQNLSRMSDTNWSFSDVVAAASVDAPASAAATISNTGTTYYGYQVTAISPTDGTESLPSPIARVSGVDIASTLGQVNVTWEPVVNVQAYVVYKAQPSYGSAVPVGALYGFLGYAYGAQFNDTNIVPDFTQVPPQHYDPFARGQIAGVNVVTGGTGYPTSTTTATINTSTGSGAVLEVVVQSGAVVAIVVDNPGSGYADGDTVTITGAGGSGATAALSVGAQTGTYPSVPGYFQQRRVLANTLNNPDTYFMSQTGAYDNFDKRIPPIDTDSIVGSPWATQVNGIQFIITTPGGLLVMTGLSAWLLTGSGGFATNAGPISPGSQNANPQAFTGCSAYIAPVKVNYDVLYVESNNSLYYDLPYQVYALNEPIDLTEYAVHLFADHTVVSNAWCEKPFKTLWSVRDDGVMLSLTFLKAEQVIGWARHDTDGLYVTNCAVREPPIDALYVGVKRYIDGHEAYTIERMNDRAWPAVEDCWCVDCALSLPQDRPDATLTCDSTYGIGNLTGVTDLVGGSGYSVYTTATVVDQNGQGPGSGAVAQLTIVDGVITGVTFAPQGSGYVYPQLIIADPTGVGSGASASPILNTTATFTASADVFTAGVDEGSVIRMGGCKATISTVLNGHRVSAVMETPITAVRPNSGGQVQPQPSGSWTLTQPVMQVSGLGYAAGATVTGLADGKIVTPRQVSSTGVVDLDEGASQIVLGFGFTTQVQSVYVEAGSPTMQGQRKKIGQVGALVRASRGVQLGVNQIDASTQSPVPVAVDWQGMQDVPDQGLPNQQVRAYNSDTDPLYTAWITIPVEGGFERPGQVAAQQQNPLPMSIVALSPSVLSGDTPSQHGGRPG